MCLAAPGRIVELVTAADAAGERLGTVDFNGSQVQVSLAMVPEAAVGDWVLVHAGYAITQLDEDEARETWEYLKEFEGVEGIEP
ncbi:MAG: HypC/HybG/HupF family hydrogenase formation chaperone [Planctomycetes bacterium]|nr:HypC/HybG/HupF family hydrogenase formation chaperone [Planctomycetota bacterium]